MGSENIRIMLDPGHFKGYNKSAVEPTYIEGDAMFTLGKLVGAELREYGIEVLFSKITEEQNPPVDMRGYAAGVAEADALLAFHSNGYDKPEISGTEIYISIFNPELKAFADELGKVISDKFGHEYRVTKTLMNDKKLDYYGVIRGAVEYG